MKNLAICSIVSKNYYAQVCNLISSIKKHCLEIPVYILIVDAYGIDGKLIFSEENKDCTTINIRDLNIAFIDEYAKKYDLVEFNTFLKPYFIKYLIDTQKLQKVVYLDPDIMIFNDLSDIFMLLDSYSIILTPHILSDKRDFKENNTLEELKYGIYNLGFIALNNTCVAIEFLLWWGEKLKSFCRLDLKHGLAWDQKWCDLVPAFFDNVYVLRSPNYNVAFWNMYERNITKRNGSYYVNDKYPLVFFHFSHYRIEYPTCLAYFDERNYILFSNNIIKDICKDYHMGLIKHGYMKYSNLKYSYD